MDENVCERTLDDVDKILHYAKLDRCEMQQPVQCVAFEGNLDNDQLKLIELDSTVLQSLQQGDRLVMRGNKADMAVLCTNDKTYDVRLAETSNTILLVPDCTLPGDKKDSDSTIVYRNVCAMTSHYYELRMIRPRLQRLRELLEQNQYSGQECEEDEHHQGHKYTLCDLMDRIQASHEELMNGLNTLQACEILGHWRMLEFDFQGRVLQSLLSLKEENDWEYNHIPVNPCCDTLEELYPRTVVENILHFFSNPLTDEEVGNSHVQFSEDKICRFFAEMLLKHANKFNLEEFERVWQLSVPEGMVTSLYQIEGLALIDRDTKPQVIHYFPLCNLPEDTVERFEILFHEKKIWTLNEITPYIKDLATVKIGVSALLTKHCRASTQKGIRVFSSKK